ncbi:uncharacterized protein N7511_001695 [Penicillium nucicola]|uniref:uncharacterized protein n=1 Tax=Penicillium nucicola TaxID=1850975 RepID=UPI00254590CE|nr:uncharacterized protein N7511_001695 [Penicillium nucicola]KAJ5776684.1 hypothetical protein N7511_001695 [Penicillium nucicola]
MPKKHQRFHTKPASPAHHSLGSSSRHDRPGASVAAESVNDLISHLRLTQTPNPSEEGASRPRPSQRSLVSSRSVHPSLRNLLELPETPPPRPRPGAQRTAIGSRPRRTAGPPPPESWLSGATDDSNGTFQCQSAHMNPRQVVHRLKRLPGVVFPDPRDLLHMVLKSMALKWHWHLDYDGPFLAQLPGRIKSLLLSYVAVYGRGLQLNGRMKGLNPLVLSEKDHIQDDEHTDSATENSILASDAAISRLDLGNALGNWMTFKQLTSELFISTKPNSELKSVIPGSWDEELDPDNSEPASSDADAEPGLSIPKGMAHGLRFTNLRYLSLAHPQPASANWNSLLNLVARLSTLTHLSLAHWPAPTRTPGLETSLTRHPFHHSSIYSYDDDSEALENHWAKAASVLRQLSQSTYCLKWLDLEGCTDWLQTLEWVGKDPDGNPYPLGASGPEWNGSWRDVEWINVGPGWVPDLSGDLETPEPQSPADSPISPGYFDGYESDTSWRRQQRSLNSNRNIGLQNYRDSIQISLDIRTHVRQIRKEGNGKWVQVSFGLEDVDSETVRTLLGQKISVVL